MSVSVNLTKGWVAGLAIGPTAASGSSTTLIAVLPPPNTGSSTSSTVRPEVQLHPQQLLLNLSLHLYEILVPFYCISFWRFVQWVRLDQIVLTVQVIQTPENHNDNHLTRYLPFHVHFLSHL
ncbi:hypothetical protein BYT27DRAFT_7255511 [Phlegmacium glaucopus]|nr:hypothetical protein BYT27DRAFT_7255511 [Phlegmacium glaucopus]